MVVVKPNKLVVELPEESSLRKFILFLNRQMLCNKNGLKYLRKNAKRGSKKASLWQTGAEQSYNAVVEDIL